MESPRNETSVDRPDKEKGRRRKATRGTVVGFKLCDCPGNRDQRWEGQMMSGNLCRRCGARVRIPVPGLIDSKGLDGLPSTGRLGLTETCGSQEGCRLITTWSTVNGAIGWGRLGRRLDTLQYLAGGYVPRHSLAYSKCL